MRYMTLRFSQRRHCWMGDKRSTISSTRPILGHGTDYNGFNGLSNSKVSDPELRRQEHMLRAVNDQSSHCASVMSSSPNRVESECIIIGSNTFSPVLHISDASPLIKIRSATRMQWAQNVLKVRIFNQMSRS